MLTVSMTTDDIADHTQQHLAMPAYLFVCVQMADDRVFQRGEDGTVSIHSTAFLEDTEEFPDIPFRCESTEPTHEFFVTSF
jgi:hypothetical protein